MGKDSPVNEKALAQSAGDASSADSNAIDLKDIPGVINAIVEICLGKKNAEDVVADTLHAYAKKTTFAIKEKASDYISEYLSRSERREVRELSEAGFADKMIAAAENIGDGVQKYFRKEINDEEFMKLLGNAGIKEMVFEALNALGIPEMLDARDAKALFEMSAATVGYRAMIAAYNEIRKALEDERIAHEVRLSMEAACAESVAMIRKFRLDMDRIVSDYLSKRYEVFETAFAAIDQSIKENDVDGYIRGNTAIQEILGYHPQFTNQEEFDELMLSDEAFRL